MDSAPSSGWSSRCDAHPAAPDSHIGNIHRDLGSFSGWAYIMGVDNPSDISICGVNVGKRTNNIGLGGNISLVLMITMVPVLPILRSGSKRPPRRAILSPNAGEQPWALRKQKK